MRKSSRIPLSDFGEGLFPEYNNIMDYQKYLDLQTRLEWFYDFHPEFFDDISSEEKTLLQKTFLYDMPDDEYPESLQVFYGENIDGDTSLQRKMLLAVDSLYRVAGAGSLFDYDDN